MSDVENSNVPVETTVVAPPAAQPEQTKSATANSSDDYLDTSNPKNPIVLAICQWFGFAFLGYYLLGQGHKALCGVIFTIIPFVGFIFGFLTVVDVYKIAVKVQAKEMVGVNHYEIKFLETLPLWNNPELGAGITKKKDATPATQV